MLIEWRCGLPTIPERAMITSDAREGRRTICGRRWAGCRLEL